ncbi:hypothetical protein EDEG_04113 [Edhazardia aedis USNM 41457]|uniref:Transcription initiation factor TFIID subunit 13 n=1 Tax=Edhazardia aedis (strain USNM 41457) TaxID=1003232 RepID=J9DCH9_EDHAE|nr:hypothetical protein EDEG_04113 [Edhazardia aedis USNM 41457]|eukprot:EJW05169.1 hypothetical protein EDEG_04113 [Edhazardia aedis USNM 41457]
MKERKKISFHKELRHMLYGFGDTINPRYDTTEVLQQYVIDYIQTVLNNVYNYSKIKGKTKTDDLLFILRKDRKKWTRVKDLLLLSEEVKMARKAFDVDVYEKEE